MPVTRDQLKGREPPQHGRSGYDNYGCRCPICTEDKARAWQEYKRRRILNRVMRGKTE